MKNTYLVAILFLVVGLVAGQFLNLNINGQEGAVIRSNVKTEDISKLRPFESYTIIEIPSGEREYACWSATSGPIFISTNGDDSGSITIGGVSFGCYAISGNVA